MADGDPIIIGQDHVASNPGNETRLSRNERTNRAVFVARNLNEGDGIRGESGSYTGVKGTSDTGFGVLGTSDTGEGVHGTSSTGTGVRGVGLDVPSVGVWGIGEGNGGAGVVGQCPGPGVIGTSTNGPGVLGTCGQPDPSSFQNAGGVFYGGIKVYNGLTDLNTNI
jgi:hypothetical protein